MLENKLVLWENSIVLLRYFWTKRIRQIDVPTQVFFSIWDWEKTKLWLVKNLFWKLITFPVFFYNFHHHKGYCHLWNLSQIRLFESFLGFVETQVKRFHMTKKINKIESFSKKEPIKLQKQTKTFWRVQAYVFWSRGYQKHEIRIKSLLRLEIKPGPILSDARMLTTTLKKSVRKSVDAVRAQKQ